MGGDYGKKLFKLLFELMNFVNPNAPDNTFPLLVANVKDTTENLVAILVFYHNQIAALQKHTWRDKNIRLFLFGDYDFMCKSYGHQGAAAVHPCLWCLISRDGMQNRTLGEMRTIENMIRNCNEFQTEGECDLKKAKHYNNIIRQPLLPIPLDHIAPPYLHFTLGIAKK